jgi:hypothetical protein
MKSGLGLNILLTTTECILTSAVVCMSVSNLLCYRLVNSVRSLNLCSTRKYKGNQILPLDQFWLPCSCKMNALHFLHTYSIFFRIVKFNFTLHLSVPCHLLFVLKILPISMQSIQSIHACWYKSTCTGVLKCACTHTHMPLHTFACTWEHICTHIKLYSNM